MKGYSSQFIKLSYLLALIVFTIFTFNARAMDFSDIQGHIFINGKKLTHMNAHDHKMMIKMNAPTNIEFFFTKPGEKEIIKDFKIMHGKLAHVVLIKSDLSEFKHVHPYFDPLSGRFHLTLNVPFSDPDNFMAENALQSGGMYMLMVDVIAKGIGMRMFHRHLMVMGQNQKQPLVEDFNENGVYSKEQSTKERDFLATLEIEKIPGCQGDLLDFKFLLKEKTENGLVDIKDFKPWLAAGAHAVIMSPNQPMMNMKMGHMHSPTPYPPEETDKDPTDTRSQDPYFVFSLHNNKILKDGLQKIWIQVKISDQIVTFPFVIQLNNSGNTCN